MLREPTEDLTARSAVVPGQLVLGDGRVVAVRSIQPDDGDRLSTFHHRLSAETVRRRFFNAHPQLTARELHHFTHVDGDRRLALVAMWNDEIVGVGRYEATDDPDEVEVAFVVRDDFQGVGLGSRLLELIRLAAIVHGKRRLCADVLPENQAMRRTFRHLGPELVEAYDAGIITISCPL